MTNDELTTAIKAERDALQTQVRGAQARIEQLNVALAALEGRVSAIPPMNGHTGPSAMDVFGGAILAFNPGTTFDHRSVVDKAAELFPAADHKNLKRGLYGVISTLKKQGRIQKVPGGFTRTP